MNAAVLEARGWAEIDYYLLVTPCPACGKGPWLVETAESAGGAAASGTCQACGHVLSFQWAGGRPAACDNEQINPTEKPSRIIDVGQWIALFHMLTEQAAKADDKHETRRLGYQAAQCLAEALKFYGDDELPPPESAYTEATQTALREHPGRFARQRLRDFQSKLPALQIMAGRVAADEEAGKPRRQWWQFWKR